MVDFSLTHPLEKPIYALAVLLNIVFFLAVLYCGFLADDWLHNSLGGELIWFVFGVVPVLVAAQMSLRVFLRSDGILLSPQQFPQVQALVVDLTHELNLERVPEIYLYTSKTEGVHVDAGDWFGKTYIFVNGDVCKMSEESLDGLKFILGREMAHLKLHHYTIWNVISLMYIIRVPLIGALIRRIRAYSCDRYGAYVSPNGVSGLFFMATDHRVYRQVDLAAYLKQIQLPAGFWKYLLGLFQDRPYYRDRVKTLYRLGLFTKPSGENASVRADSAVTD